MAERTLLAVFAHPDDETFLAGSTLAYYGAREIAVHLCCVTPERSEDPHSEVARRRASLSCAAEVLGLRQVHHLDLSEAELGRLSVEDLAGRLAAVLEAVSPQVIVTDAAYGSYGHPHHILVHRATVAAVKARAWPGPSPRLYALAFPLALVRLNERIMRLLGVPTQALGGRPDLNLQTILRADHPTTVRLKVQEFVMARRKAALCYAQDIAAAPLPLRLLEGAPLWVQQAVFGQACFTRVFPPCEPGETPKDDLFG